MLQITALALLFASSVPAVGMQVPPSSQSPAVAAQTRPAAPAKEKKICRSDSSTGSIMPVRTCHTQAEWDSISQANQAAAQQMMEGRLNGVGTPR